MKVKLFTQSEEGMMKLAKFFVVAVTVLVATMPSALLAQTHQYKDGIFVRIQPKLAANGRSVVEGILGDRGRIVEENKGKWLVEFRGNKVTKEFGQSLHKNSALEKVEPLLPQFRPASDPTSVKQVSAAIESQRTRLATLEKLKKHDPKAKTRRPGLGYTEAYEYDLRMRAYPNDKLDIDAYIEAREHLKTMRPATLEMLGTNLNDRSAQSTPRWEFVGPRNLQVPYRIYYGIPPLSGRINAVAIHPTNTNIIYIGTTQGGVFRSTNAGSTWVPLSDNWEYLAVSCIAIDPTNPNRIYVGTGDYPGMKLPYAIGIMRTGDGGATWTNVGRTEMQNNCVSDIIIVPEFPNRIIASTGRGRNTTGKIWVSNDFGGSWNGQASLDADWSDLSLGIRDQFGNRLVWAASAGRPAIVMSSDNYGASWFPHTTFNDIEEDTNTNITASVVDPYSFYAMFPNRKKIYKGTFDGIWIGWRDISDGFISGDQDYNWSQGFYDTFLACSYALVNNQYVDVIYVGLIDVVQSPDGGNTWRSIGGPVYDPNHSILHSDQHSIAFLSQNQFLIGCDGGLFRMTYNPAGPSINNVSLNKSIPITQFYKASWHPNNPNIMMGGTQDNATPVSRGDLNNWLNRGGGDGGGNTISQTNPNFAMASAQFLGLYRTFDGWQTQQQIGMDVGQDVKPFVAHLESDPNNGYIVYVGTDYLWRLNNQNNSIAPRLGGTKMALAERAHISTIAVSNVDSRFIYTGTQDGKVWMTMNSGATWRQIQQGLPNRAITDIDIHPRNKYDILVTVSGTGTGRVYRCANTAGTITWQDRSGGGFNRLPNVPANAITRNPWYPDTFFYVATDYGVFVTPNGGSTWASLNQSYGIPIVQVNDIKFVENTRYLNIATFARGMYRLRMSAPAAAIQSLTISPTRIKGGNTATGVIWMNVNAPTGGYRITVWDNSAAISVPATVTIPAGRKYASFTINSVRVRGTNVATVAARYGTVAKTAQITVVP